MNSLSYVVHPVSLAPLALALLSCVGEGYVYDEVHCANRDGNAWCARYHEGTAPYCTSVLSERCANDFLDGCSPIKSQDNECYSPCGNVQTLADDPDQRCDQFEPTTGTTSTDTTSATMGTSSGTTTVAATGDTSEGSTGGESGESTTGTASGCASDNECSGDAPFCNLIVAECVPCSGTEDPDAACASFDPTAPVCFEDECVACTEDNAGACKGDEPACLDNECVECTAENTEACDEERPVCNDVNECVVCSGDSLGACGGVTPLCFDEGCVKCVAHEECPAGSPSRNAAACDYGTGACFPDDDVWHVDGDAACSAATGSEGTPFCTIAEAVLQAQSTGQGTVILHERTEGGIDNYAGVVVPAAVRLAILAAEGETPRIQGAGENPGLRVEAGATVYLDGLIIGGNQGQNGNGLEVEGTVYADNVEVSSNRGLGVFVTGTGEFFAHRSRIISNTAGGVRIEVEPDDGGDSDGGTGTGAAESSSGGSSESGGTTGLEMQQAMSGMPYAYLENCFVAQTNNNTDAVAAIGGRAEMLYSTLAASGSFGEPARALYCDAESMVTARNSLFVAAGEQDEVECVELDASTNAAEMNLGGTNTSLNSMTGFDWFEDFFNGNLLLSTPPQPLLTAAVWQADDPTTDIGGVDLRPTQPGTPDVAGADIPTPIESESE